MISPAINQTPAFISHCFIATTAMDDPLSFMHSVDTVITQMLDEFLYYSFIERGLHQTAEVFRLETGAHFAPLPPFPPPSPISPLSPIEDDVPWENSLGRLLIINEAGQLEWVALSDYDGSSNHDEGNIWQQSGLTPTGEHELNEQMFEELTLDDIFGGTDNQGLASVVEACQSSKIVSNECGVDVEEDDAWDFSITNDLIELSYIVNGKKNEEWNSCSQDAYLYDSSSFDLGNEDGVIHAFNFDESHEAPNIDEMQGVTVEGNLVHRTMPHLERLTFSSTPANIEDTDTPGPQSVVQTIPRTTELASNESGRKRKWFEFSGDGEGDYSTRSAHIYGSSCGKGNDYDGVSLHSGSHQINELQGVESTSSAS